MTDAKEQAITLGPVTVVRAFRPGDVVFVEVSERYPPEAFKALSENCKALLEQSGVRVVILDYGMKVFAAADAATGTKVLEEMYAQMKDKPVAPDLNGLWAKLGVVSDGGSITLHDDAPLADIRRAIMQPRELRPANKT